MSNTNNSLQTQTSNALHNPIMKAGGKDHPPMVAPDNTSRINRGTRYDNQRVVNVAGARENVGTHVVQQSRIQCYNCKEYRHVARNSQTTTQRDDTDDEPEDQKLEAHYLYMAQIQEVTSDVADNSGPIFDVEPL
ncbi:hypothetical protein Tco_1315171 [Tanacetum coccineum]